MNSKNAEIILTRKDGSKVDMAGDFAIAAVINSGEDGGTTISVSLEGRINEYSAAVFVLRLLPALRLDLATLSIIAMSGKIGEANYEE